MAYATVTLQRFQETPPACCRGAACTRQPLLRNRGEGTAPAGLNYLLDNPCKLRYEDNIDIDIYINFRRTSTTIRSRRWGEFQKENAAL